LEDKFRAMLNTEDEEPQEINLDEELEILDEAYQNAYLVATNRMTVKELLEADGEMTFLPFDPEAPETIAMVIDDVIDYFSDEEEFEKCAELMRVKKKLDDI
jgi:hypothetical protein